MPFFDRFHCPVALRFALLGAMLLNVAALAGIGSAQIDPDDTGAGTKLGMAQSNNSGETGTVSVFRGGPHATLVVISLAGQPPGRQQPAQVRRGHACDDLDSKPAFGLAPVLNGVSRTLVEAPEAKLLSGNYLVTVLAPDKRATRYLSCAELHR